MFDRNKPLSWWAIIGFMVGAGLAAGLIIGGLSTMMKLPRSVTTSGVGAVIGIVGALLITKRAAQLKEQEDTQQ